MLARIPHQLPAAVANPLAAMARTPSSRFDAGSATLSASAKRSFGPCGASTRRLDALATKVVEICGQGVRNPGARR